MGILREPVSRCNSAAKRFIRVIGFREVRRHWLLDITAHLLRCMDWRHLSKLVGRRNDSPMDNTLGTDGPGSRRAGPGRHLDYLSSSQRVLPSDQPDIVRLKAHWQTVPAQNLNHAYVAFFQRLGWPLLNINCAAQCHEPVAITVSEQMGLEIPLLAPGPREGAPLGIAEETLVGLSARYPDGAIVLLAEPSVDVINGHTIFSPGLMVIDGRNWSITLNAARHDFDSLFEFGQDRYRALVFADTGEWASRTFARFKALATAPARS